MNTDVHDSDTEPDGFPLTVDLSTYVGTPARCRVWVRTRARKIRWLASRVRRAARLRGPILLMAGGCLLPPGEPLRVIRTDDTLSVARVEHKWQRPFSFQEDEDAPAETNADETTNFATLTLPTPLGKPVPPEKHIMQESATIMEPPVKPALKRQRPNPTMEPTLEELVPLEDNEKLNRVKQRALALLQQVSGDAIEEDVVDAPKKKRRRVRRRRPCKDLNIDLSVEAVESTLNETQLQSVTKSDETLEVTEESYAVRIGYTQNGTQFQSFPRSNESLEVAEESNCLQNGSQNGTQLQSIPRSNESLEVPEESNCLQNGSQNETQLQSFPRSNESLEVPEQSNCLQNGSQNGTQFQSFPRSNDSLEVREETNERTGSIFKSQMPHYSVPTSHAVPLSMTSVPPSPTILTYPPPSMLVRNPTPPRAPRVVRALTAETSENGGRSS